MTSKERNEWRKSERRKMIFELLNEDNNEGNLLHWSDCFLGSLSYKSLQEIYKRELGK